MNRLLLKPAEVSDTLGISRTKVYALLATGELPSIRIGRSVRVATKALEEWIEQQARGAADDEVER